jgi:integrase
MPEFTSEFLSNLPVPPRKPDGRVNQKIYFDPSFNGFGVRVASTGARAWIFQCRANGRVLRATFDGKLDVNDARAEAAALRKRIKSGDAPAAQAPAPQDAKPGEAAETFLSAAKRFIGHARATRRPSTATTYGVLTSSHFAALHDLPLSAVSRADIARAVARIRDAGRNVRANRAVASVSAMYGWLLQRGEIDQVPAMRGLRVREHGRSRHLAGNLEHGQPCEIPLLWRACEAMPLAYRAVCELLLLTGCRRNEISDLQWSEIITGDALGPRIVLPAGRVKNGSPHTVPVGPYALSLLEAMPRSGDAVFESPRGGRFVAHTSMRNCLNSTAARIRAGEPDKYAGQLIDPFTLHDLRRTFASGLRQLGAPLEIIDSLLNHRTGAANEGTRGVYIHADDWPERRAWAEKWERHVIEIGAAGC